MSCTISLSVGKWGGINYRSGYAKRLCLGWIAIHFFPEEVEGIILKYQGIVELLNHKKRYLLFGGDSYYPTGGIDDFIDASDNLDLLISGIGYLRKGNYGYILYKGKPIGYESPSGQWVHIYDTEEKKMVYNNAV